MTIQSVGIANTHTNINNDFKRPANQIEKPKENTDGSYDTKENEIGATLSGLAILSLAGIGIAAALRKSKVPSIPNSSGTVKGAQTVSNSLCAMSKETPVISEVSAAVQKDTPKLLQQTGKQIVKNVKHTMVKETSAGNINKPLKPACQDDLAKRAETRANMLKKDAAVRQTLKDASRSIASSAGDIKNAGQGMKSAADVKALDEKAMMAQNAAKDIANNAQKIKDIANEVPTHKNIKRAKVAENKAIRAELDANRVQEKVDKKKTEIALDKTVKEQNIQNMINNTTPERLLEGQKKMEENAQKTSAKAIQRKADRKVNRPGYQRALNKFQSFSKEKLQSIINSKKSSNIEKTVAQDLLAATDKV